METSLLDKIIDEKYSKLSRFLSDLLSKFLISKYMYVLILVSYIFGYLTTGILSQTILCLFTILPIQYR